MLSGMLLQRVADVGAGDMSLRNPASPFSNTLSTFCMMELSQGGMRILYGVCSSSVAGEIQIDAMSSFLIYFMISALYNCASNPAPVQPAYRFTSVRYHQPWQLLSRRPHHEKVRLVETMSVDHSITSSHACLRDCRPSCFQLFELS